MAAKILKFRPKSKPTEVDPNILAKEIKDLFTAAEILQIRKDLENHES